MNSKEIKRMQAKLNLEDKNSIFEIAKEQYGFKYGLSHTREATKTKMIAFIINKVKEGAQPPIYKKRVVDQVESVKSADEVKECVSEVVDVVDSANSTGSKHTTPDTNVMVDQVESVKSTDDVKECSSKVTDTVDSVNSTNLADSANNDAPNTSGSAEMADSTNSTRSVDRGEMEDIIKVVEDKFMQKMTALEEEIRLLKNQKVVNNEVNEVNEVNDVFNEKEYKKLYEKRPLLTKKNRKVMDTEEYKNLAKEINLKRTFVKRNEGEKMEVARRELYQLYKKREEMLK